MHWHGRLHICLVKTNSKRGNPTTPSVNSTKEKTTKDDIVVEMKTDTKTEEAVLLKGVNGDKKGPGAQVTMGQ